MPNPTLTGLALVTAVAERVMGWRLINWNDFHDYDYDNDPDDIESTFHIIAPPNRSLTYIWRGSSAAGEKWEPLKYMSDCWEVVTALKAKGYIVIVEDCTEFAQVQICDKARIITYQIRPTAQEAILQASLAAVDGKEGQP